MDVDDKLLDLTEMRNYHNQVKAQLYKIAAKRTRSLREHPRVMDLGIGTAGDLNKWANINVEWVFGLDISEEDLFNSKDSAIKRHKDLMNNGKTVPFPLILRQADVFHPDLDTIPTECIEIASSMFVLNHGENFDNYLMAVSQALVAGGIFIATYLDGRKLLDEKLFKQTDEVQKKDGFSLQLFLDKNKYIFRQLDKNARYFTKEVQETFFDVHDFMLQAAKYNLHQPQGLEINAFGNLPDMFLPAHRKWPPAAKEHLTLSPEQEFLSGLYGYVILEKVAPSSPVPYSPQF